jgi:hypothetical protein
MANNPCGALTLNPNSSAVCSPGFIKGMFLYETKPSAITETNAALQATWDALAVLDQPTRQFNITFDNTEGAEPEIIQEDFTDGAQQIVQTKEGASTYEIIASLGAWNTIYNEFENGKIMYYYPYTDTNVILGKEVTPNTIEAIKMRMWASYKPATGETTEKIVIQIQDLENWRKFRTEVKPTAFQCIDIESVQGMALTATDDTLTTLVVEAKTLNKVGITDLDIVGAGQWILNNTTDPALVTVTSITRSGYAYTLNFVAQTEADAWSLSYEEPSTSGEYYDVTTTITGTFTA